MNSKQRFRARGILIIIIIVAAVLAAGLYWIQIANGSQYSSKANKQYVKPTVSLFDRGSIYFESKDGTKVAAATVSSGYLLYMNPSMIKDVERAYDAISQYISLDKADFMKRSSKTNDVYEELKHRIDDNVAQSIRTLNIPGIFVVKENWRSYPGNELAAHTLGIVGESMDSDIVEGKYGLESYYDSVLKRDGIGNSASVFAQLFSGISSVFGSSDVTGDLVTTLEPATQKYLEEVLSNTSKKWNPDEIGGIIMDPHTGEIIAEASLPSFDPNNTKSAKDVSVFSNPLVEHVYELGSIMKPLTMATALDSGAVTPSSTYNDTGTMTLSTKTISNYDGKARGITPMQEILSQSLNVGAATIALKVGAQGFNKYFAAFGFGVKTGIDQPNEATGIIGNLKTGRDIEVATAAYGQGIAISPVEMTRALATLANGGYMVNPHVVKEIEYSDGTVKKTDIVKDGPVLKAETVNDVTKMLIKVVDEKIAKAHPDIYWTHYSIAAKTGTAQIADHVKGGYYPDRYLHSFFGYFPAYDPKYIVFLYQIYPKGAEYASETLTDPFSDLTKFLINYYNISPDR